jgi:hypothetical protein
VVRYNQGKGVKTLTQKTLKNKKKWLTRESIRAIIKKKDREVNKNDKTDND